MWGIPFPGWLSVHLLEFAARSGVARSVILSVFRNFKSIVWALVLILLVVYFYAIVGFTMFRKCLCLTPRRSLRPSRCVAVCGCAGSGC